VKILRGLAFALCKYLNVRDKRAHSRADLQPRAGLPTVAIVT
jgi:hypothetical protein